MYCASLLHNSVSLARARAWYYKIVVGEFYKSGNTLAERSPSPCLSDGATVAASVAGGGKGRGMGSTHGGGESSVSVNHPASEASKESAERRKRGEAERRERGDADVIGRDDAYMATECATSAGEGARILLLL